MAPLSHWIQDQPWKRILNLSQLSTHEARHFFQEAGWPSCASAGRLQFRLCPTKSSRHVTDWVFIVYSPTSHNMDPTEKEVRSLVWTGKVALGSLRDTALTDSEYVVSNFTGSASIVR